MFSALLVTFREGLEAALIVAILISLLDRFEARSLARWVWAGAGAAAAASVVSGTILFTLAGEAAKEAGEVFEILVVFSAVLLLTYMILWMRKNGRGAQSRLVQKSSAAVKAASPFALGALAFVAVGREGLETVLFLLAGASGAGGVSLVVGGLIGLSLAIGTGFIFYRGSLRIDISTLFKVTGALLIVFAAGFLGRATGELGETGWWPGFFSPALDLSGSLSDQSGLGAVLKSLAGYDSSPAIAQIVAYWSYLGAMLWLFLRPDREASVARRAAKAAITANTHPDRKAA